MRFGTVVYKNEVEELMARLRAKGIVLIVIKGKRNHDDVEFSSMIEGSWVAFTAGAMAQTALAMLRRLEDFHPEIRRNENG